MVRQRRAGSWAEGGEPPYSGEVRDGDYRASLRNQPPAMAGLRKGKRCAANRAGRAGASAPPSWLGTALMWAFIAALFVMTGVVRIGNFRAWWEMVETLKGGGPRAVRRHPSPPVSTLPLFQGVHRERLFWGTYRPHLYLGIRARVPESLLGGLMWVQRKEGRYHLRHTCQDGDGLQKYGWLRHDGSKFGRQQLIDGNLHLATYFLKHHGHGSGYGGDWAVRIVATENGTPTTTASGDEDMVTKKKTVSLLFYFTDESGKSFDISAGERGSTSPAKSAGKGLLAVGKWGEVGTWQLHVRGKKGAADESYVGLKALHVHNLTEVVWGTLVENSKLSGKVNLPNSVSKRSNLVVYQITAEFPLKLDIIFISNVVGDERSTAGRVDGLSGAQLSAKLADEEAAFDKRFDDTFELHGKGVKDAEAEVAKAALSNLLGGMGFFYGQSKIAAPGQEHGGGTQDHLLYWPASLYTAVPSRPMFPRGFLWDEGFHQLLIGKWDRNISMDAMASWLDLMNVDGWIPREQILGEEARMKVPAEFVLQHTSNANPPTLFLPIQELAKQLASSDTLAAEEGEREAVRTFLKRSFPRLQSWFHWFNTSQIGQLPGSYFWHGRDANTNSELNPKTLMSGLDDYPRASHPGNEERHLDLRCWMALAADSLAVIAKMVGERHEHYEATAAWLSDINLLNSLHLDLESGRYYDYGNHSDKVYLQPREYVDARTGYFHRSFERVVLKAPGPALVPHFGYVSLFPLLIKLLPPNSDNLRQQLQLLRDETLLWTKFGLRSLATTSSLYNKRNTEHDAPYWRGPVWINVNYLALSALKHYASVEGHSKQEAQRLYAELRENVIRNVVQRYQESGYLWENYDHMRSGKGKGAHPFTGWTSLIVLIMAETF
ncbi:hypothetical protein CBR_g11887 [Chara braunii]|uniref:Mannosyl-oligosaccharide glucosidase n=1 Tax=Chara braunii TaxID=69332 RepID=A0A388JSG3_CHABU|nr:hypothetical protein CBR_g11887 [Chara braunii]|eukprot:GBG60662.1 hypothetical protein CBR_g11887 [Chara braunii]